MMAFQRWNVLAWLAAAVVVLSLLDGPVVHMSARGDGATTRNCTGDGDCAAAGAVSTCSGGYCACPTGWTVSADLLTCSAVPVADNPVVAPVAVPVYSICFNNSDCPILNAHCNLDGNLGGLKRCICNKGYIAYGNNQYCGKIVTSFTNPSCSICEGNDGDCYVRSTNDSFYDTDAAVTPITTHCVCPISKDGTNCEISRVNVTCDGKLEMKICYDKHAGVDFTDNLWTMAPDNYNKVPACVGVTVLPDSTEASWCAPGFQALTLKLDKANLAKCGTSVVSSTSSRTYENQIVVMAAELNIQPIIFQTFCTYKSYDDQTFDGLGVYWSNGNSNGQVVNPDISLNITDRNGNALSEGVRLRVGDLIKFMITLNTSATYKGMNVPWCSASSSSVIPNSHAETVPIITTTCPLTSAPGGVDRWYWNKVTSSSPDLLVIQTGNIPAFKLSSSSVVYMHCTVKLCLESSDSSCALPNKATCAGVNARKRRSPELTAMVGSIVNLHGYAAPNRHRRASSDSYDLQRSFEVYGEELDYSSKIGISQGGVTALIVILVIVVIALVIIGATIAFRVRRNQHQNYKVRADEFPMPRLQAPYNRF